jgi:hypothetical protein
MATIATRSPPRGIDAMVWKVLWTLHFLKALSTKSVLTSRQRYARIRGSWRYGKG